MAGMLQQTSLLRLYLLLQLDLPNVLTMQLDNLLSVGGVCPIPMGDERQPGSIAYPPKQYPGQMSQTPLMSTAGRYANCNPKGQHTYA